MLKLPVVFTAGSAPTPTTRIFITPVFSWRASFTQRLVSIIQGRQSIIKSSRYSRGVRFGLPFSVQGAVQRKKLPREPRQDSAHEQTETEKSARPTTQKKTTPCFWKSAKHPPPPRQSTTNIRKDHKSFFIIRETLRFHLPEFPDPRRTWNAQEVSQTLLNPFASYQAPFARSFERICHD